PRSYRAHREARGRDDRVPAPARLGRSAGQGAERREVAVYELGGGARGEPTPLPNLVTSAANRDATGLESGRSYSARVQPPAGSRRQRTPRMSSQSPNGSPGLLSEPKRSTLPSRSSTCSSREPQG